MKIKTNYETKQTPAPSPGGLCKCFASLVGGGGVLSLT